MVSVKYYFSVFWRRLNKIMFRIQGSRLGHEPTIPEWDALLSMTGRGRWGISIRQPSCAPIKQTIEPLVVVAFVAL